jgi:hypothetical protein
MAEGGRARGSKFFPANPFIRIPNLIHEGKALMTQSLSKDLLHWELSFN